MVARPIFLASLARSLVVLPLACGVARAAPPPPPLAMTPGSPSDIYVQGKFDKKGTYIPPHYAPKPKPTFHGYFDGNVEVKHGYFDKPKPKPIDPNDPNATSN